MLQLHQFSLNSNLQQPQARDTYGIANHSNELGAMQKDPQTSLSIEPRMHDISSLETVQSFNAAARVFLNSAAAATFGRA